MAFWESNVVIIGGGISGMATAVMLADIPGLSVTMLEGQSKLGGIFRTPFSAPGFYYPSSREDMIALDTLIGNTTIVDDFYSDLTNVIKILEEKKVIQGKSLMGFDNYIVDGDEKIQNTYGLDLLSWLPRALVTGWAKWNIWRGSDFWYHLTYRILAAFNLIEICDQLKSEVENTGINIHYNSRVSEVKQGQVVTEEGDIYNYDYLVFASGGLGSNTELKRIVYDVKLKVHEFNRINTGIALQTARDMGWSYNKELYAWYAEVVELHSGEFSAVLFQPGPAVMTVNRSGKRVYNEKRCYNERGRVTLVEKELLLITDKDNIKRNTPSNIPAKYTAYLPPLENGLYIEASSIGELSEKVRDENILSNLTNDFEYELLEQWNRYHSFVESGIDPEFQRGKDIGEVLDGGDPSKPPASLLKNKAMAPIDEENLVAIRLLPSSLDTCSGPTVDSSSRVQKLISSTPNGKESLEPIENVFSVGNSAEAILGGHYTAPGLPLSSGLVGAYRTYKYLKENLENKSRKHLSK